MKQLLQRTNFSNENKREQFSHLKGPKREEAFHQFLFTLYKRLGWNAKSVDGQIHLYDGGNKEAIFLVIETVAKDEKVTMKEALSSLRSWMVGKTVNGVVSTDYAIVSMNGFEEDVYALEEFHCRLDDWGYVEHLLTSVDGLAETPMELLPHNQFAYRKIKEEWKKSKKVAVVQATGTGKTYLAIKCLADFGQEKKLILAPSLPILNQFRANMPKDIDNICYMTYQKAMFLEEEEIKTMGISLIIMDEFHRVGAEKWGEGVQNITTVYPEAHVLGLSATPVRYLDNARDMAEEFFDSHIATKLTLEDALAKHILPAPTYISALYTLEEEVLKMLERIEKSRNKEDEKKQMRRELDVIRKNWDKSMGIPTILRKHAVGTHNKFIIFTESKEHLLEMKGQVTEWFKEAYPGKEVRSFEVRSEKGRKQNEETMMEFATSIDDTLIHLLFSINMLNEGVHVSDVSGVVLLRKTVSPTIYYQQIGRALQAGKTKKPIIFDFVNNFNHISIQYLQNNVEKALEREKEKRKTYELPFAVSSIEVEDETMNVQALFQTIEKRLIQSWNELFELLTAYEEEHGNCLVPHDSYYGGKNLGNWVGAQRTLFKEGQLSKEKIEKLSSIGFVFNFYEDKWLEAYHSLQKYHQENGHVFLPFGLIINGRNMESWTNTQRKLYRSNELSEEKVQLLEAIDFPFDPFQEAWDDMYEELKAFNNEYGYCSVTRNYESNGKRVGAWLEQQRHYKRKERLSTARMALLEALGVIWEPHADRWSHMLELLKEYHSICGDLMVPADYEVEGVKLGNWVTDQRVQYKKEKLLEERKSQLEAIGFIWDAKEAAWEDMYQELVSFHQTAGHCSVPTDYEVNGKKIGNWTNTQRAVFKKGKLSEGKIEKLAALSFIWDQQEQKWQDMFQLLAKYQETNGHLQVPYTYEVNGKKLGVWVYGQKTLIKKGALPEERLNQLNEIQFS